MNAPKTKTVKVVSLQMVRERSVKYEPVSRKEDVRRIVASILERSAIEKFVVIGLDNSNRPNVIHVNYGAVSQCAAHPSTIFKILLLSNSVSFVIAHNHPGDSMEPSSFDWLITERLRRGGEEIEVELVDHVIFNEDASESVSLRNNARWGRGG